ncbi:colanic acid biosynthesis acetyltransferase WcaF [Pseudarthrobacter sp. NIBRBAC000502772]|uniref:DapH/DapD/GlmU-related protein n=1 Tax=Pseudarthrobacter sp. NIBRBAC000502772 TaxID=2590775 RepID=UPI0011311AC6|nr:DapH/DapD/GlmU-related protein [Pseudarthrobacter sp. NIBRBAC000502772]QDG68088.1 colanic acid biosynthesis acetyltransferase WcaF [Pseudarthrobacter sp. NIBRBAC000502772]
MSKTHPLVNLAAFDGHGLDRGRSKAVEVAWWACKLAIIQTNFPWPSGVRKRVLTAFGAKIGSGFYMRPGVNIHFPWKFTAGDNVWIGDRCTILNLEPVRMGNNSALAHEVYLAAGGHDIRSPKFDYANAPITIGEGVWVGTRAYVGPGVEIGESAVVAAGAVVVRRVEASDIVAGVPARPIGRREIMKEE